MIDSILVFVIVALACAYLARRFFGRKPASGGCGCGCGGCSGKGCDSGITGRPRDCGC